MEKKKEFIINFVYYSCLLVILYLIIKYLLPLVVPFIIGFIIAFIVRKISIAIFGKPGQKRQIVVLCLFYSILLLILSVGSVIIVNQIKNINYAGIYSNYIEPAINIVYNNVVDLNEIFPANVANVLTQALSSIFDSLKSLLSQISGYVVIFVTNLISSVPSTIITTIVVIVSSIYFVLDFKKVKEAVYNHLPKKMTMLIDDVIIFSRDNIFKILKAYGTIIIITFTELLIGFWILRINNSALLALMIAIMDILPIVGVGTALIPWFLIEIIMGQYWLWLGLLVIYVIITIVRNIIEPRLVGTNLGLPPLVTLIGMIVGLGLAGLVGMIGLPLLFAFIIYLKNKHIDISVEQH